MCLCLRILRVTAPIAKCPKNARGVCQRRIACCVLAMIRRDTGCNINCQVKDLHTDEQVATMTGSSQYDIYETNMLGQETFLIELTCGDQNEKCSSFGNIFSMSYYCEYRLSIEYFKFLLQNANTFNFIIHIQGEIINLINIID